MSHLQALFARMIMMAGFEKPRVENMSCGIVAISIARKKDTVIA